MGAVYVRRSDGSSDTYYLTTDHLGSTDKLLKAATGTVQVAESFAPFGARRGSDWQGAPSAADLTAIGNSTPDGFTGHEMLDGVGLIHMRGRVYDPAVGRFLSVDPIVRAVDASQSWNGYGYVEGRTLSWTDPDGWAGQRITTIGNVQPVNPPPPPPLPTGSITTRTTHHFYDIEIVFRTTGDFMRMSGGRGNAASFGSVNEAQEVDRESQVPSEDVEEPQSQPCTSDGTVTGFLEQHGAEVFDRTLGIVGGTGQMVLGATICSGVATCAGGALLAAHGASNIYEGVTGTSSLLRDGYHAVLGSAGDVAYSLVNIGTSVYGLTRPVVRPGTWNLFRNISSDYVPAFRAMTGTELVTEGAGIISDGLRAAGVPSQTCKRP